MKIKLILVASLVVALTGCSTYKAIQAPCTYEDRSGCGKIVPMQQPVNAKTTEKQV